MTVFFFCHRTHVQNLSPLIESKALLAGGASFLLKNLFICFFTQFWFNAPPGAMFVDRHPEPGETPQFRGSAVIIQADSPGEVLELLRKDIYAETGVWDLEKAQIIPVSFFFVFFR